MRTSTKILFVGISVFALGLLMGCNAGLTGELGGTGKAIQSAGEQLTAEGQQTGNPLTSIAGTIFEILGLGTVLVGGVGAVAGKKAATVTDQKIATYDAAPDHVAFAPDGTQIPVAPTPPKA